MRVESWRLRLENHQVMPAKNKRGCPFPGILVFHSLHPAVSIKGLRRVHLLWKSVYCFRQFLRNEAAHHSRERLPFCIAFRPGVSSNEQGRENICWIIITLRAVQFQEILLAQSACPIKAGMRFSLGVISHIARQFLPLFLAEYNKSSTRLKIVSSVSSAW